MESNGPSGFGYRVVYSGKVQDDLKVLADRAREHGMISEFRIALRIIDTELHRDPRRFGDPYYRLPLANVTIFGRILSCLSVAYAVHDEKSLVFVRAFALYPADAF